MCLDFLLFFFEGHLIDTDIFHALSDPYGWCWWQCYLSLFEMDYDFVDDHGATCRHSFKRTNLLFHKHFVQSKQKFHKCPPVPGQCIQPSKIYWPGEYVHLFARGSSLW